MRSFPEHYGEQGSSDQSGHNSIAIDCHKVPEEGLRLAGETCLEHDGREEDEEECVRFECDDFDQACVIVEVLEYTANNDSH